MPSKHSRPTRTTSSCNILSATLGALDRLDEEHEYGTRSLCLKDAVAREPAFDLSRVPVPPFDSADPRRNIIAFSLYGADPCYTEGAILNARAARFIYLGWTCRFYIDDSVPRPVVQGLSGEGAQVMSVNGLPSATYGTLWRFLVANDDEVSRYIIRDADSVVNIRESVAVDEWLQSNRHFHLMRDHYDHSELVLAGMWGGVRGALPALVPAIRTWLANARQVPGKTTTRYFCANVCGRRFAKASSPTTVSSRSVRPATSHPLADCHPAFGSAAMGARC